MELLTQELRAKFPPLRATEGKKPEDIEIIAKFFNPTGNFIWYPIEFDRKDIFFGYVRGFENELGYFSLKELESVKGPFRLGIERDLYFGKHTLAEVMKERL